MKKSGYRLLAVIMALVMLAGVMAPAMTASAAVGVYLPDGMTFSVTSQDNVFTITRSSGEGAVRVYYRTCSITAVASVHFEHAEGALDFEDGETEKTVTVTERAPEDIPVLFRYQGGTFREYRFEVMDHLYSLLAYTVRRIGYGSTYRFTNANVLTEVPELVWYYRRNKVESSLSSGQYRDVTAQGTEDPVQVKDEGYGQNCWSIPTAAATSRSGMGCGEYLSAIGDDLYATVFFPMWEVNDGYQYIQILADEATDFDGTDPDHDVNQPQKSVYKACWELCKGNYVIKDDGDYIMVFPHLTDAVNEDAEKIDRGYPADYEDDTPSVFPYPDTYLYKQMFRSADLRAAASNALVLDPATENLIVRFNARGSGEDTWVFRDLKGRFAVADTRAPAANEILVSRSPVGFRTHDLISVTVTFSEIVHAENAVLRTTWGDLKAESTNGSDANVLTFTGRISASAGTALRILGYTGTIRDMKGYDCAQFSKSMNTTTYQLKEPMTISYTAGGAMRIANAYDMLYYADMLETRPNMSAQLECDVRMVCSELVPFQSMAGTQAGFAGTFDGQDHTIRQLRVLTPSGGYTALFAKTETGAVIRNLKIEAEFTPEVGSFAPVVGYNRGTVEKCAAYFEFPDVFESTGHTATDATCVGGVVALNAGTIRLCSADGLLRMRWPKGSFGGIAGKNTGTMESSYFTGTLREYPGASSVVGGVCGVNSGAVRNCCDAITDSYSHVAIRSNTGTTENVQHLIDTAAASGEVCWVLNGGVTDGSQGWYQNIDNGQTPDPRPGFVNNRENTVYHIHNTYTNTPVLHDGENDVLLRRSTEYQTFLFCPAQAGWYSFYSVGANVDAAVYFLESVDGESVPVYVSSDADSAGGDFLCSAYLSTVIDYYVRLRLYSGADAAVTIVAETSQTLYTVTVDADAPYLTDFHMNAVEADLPESETTMQAPAGAEIRMAAQYIAAVDPETCGFQVTDALGSEIPVSDVSVNADERIFEGSFRMPASDVTVTPAAQLYPALHLGENELHCDSEQTFSFTPSRDDGTYTIRNSTDGFTLIVYDYAGDGGVLLQVRSENIPVETTLESGKSYPVVITPQVDTDFTVTIEYVPNQHEIDIHEDTRVMTTTLYNAAGEKIKKSAQGERVYVDSVMQEGFVFDGYIFVIWEGSTFLNNVEVLYDDEKEMHYFLMPANDLTIFPQYVEASAVVWGDPTYAWEKADGDWFCTATRVSLNCSGFTESESVQAVSSVDVDATCTEAGQTVYTATFENEAFETQSQTLADIAPTGHSFTNYVYNGDATAKADGTETAVCDHGCGETHTRPAVGTQLANDEISVTISDGIGVNFLLELDHPSRAAVQSVTVTYNNFSGETVTETRHKSALPVENGKYKLTVWIAPAQLADVISVKVGGEDAIGTSVLNYCGELIAGDFAQKYKDVASALEQYAQAANVTFGYSADTITDIADLDKDAVTAYTGAVFTDGTNKVTGASFMALTKPEFRFYTAGITEQQGYDYNEAGVTASMENGGDTLHARFVKKADGKVLLEVTGVSAENMDKTVTVTVTGLGDITFNGNAFAKAMASSSDTAQQNLGAALYNYGAAAKKCFTAEKIVDLGTLTGDYEAQNGDVLTGTLAGKYKLTVADGANITLKDADVTCLDSGAYFAAITPLGDATVTLEGSNIVMGGNGVPGIYVPEDKTLTIGGTGSLEASSTSDACGIGGANQISAGNIVINGGTVTAYGGFCAAGIGCGPGADCGDIIINGGTVTAYGGHQSAGIGSAVGGNCGDITINGGTVTAYGGRESVGIGSGEYGSCGDITISGGTVTAVADENAIRPGIGSGDMYSRCGNVLIKNTVTAVYAVSSGGPGRVDPIGTRYGTCGTVTIEDGANVVMY